MRSSWHGVMKIAPEKLPSSSAQTWYWNPGRHFWSCCITLTALLLPPPIPFLPLSPSLNPASMNTILRHRCKASSSRSLARTVGSFERSFAANATARKRRLRRLWESLRKVGATWMRTSRICAGSSRTLVTIPEICSSTPGGIRSPRFFWLTWHCPIEGMHTPVCLRRAMVMRHASLSSAGCIADTNHSHAHRRDVFLRGFAGPPEALARGLLALGCPAREHFAMMRGWRTRRLHTDQMTAQGSRLRRYRGMLPPHLRQRVAARSRRLQPQASSAMPLMPWRSCAMVSDCRTKQIRTLTDMPEG
eukprot:m.188623 g.188623  ORF g.188623 m.188623 type:complete len:304 (-) comp10026_c0_seq4:114-1025(-)